MEFFYSGQHDKTLLQVRERNSLLCLKFYKPSDIFDINIEKHVQSG